MIFASTYLKKFCRKQLFYCRGGPLEPIVAAPNQFSVLGFRAQSRNLHGLL